MGLHPNLLKDCKHNMNLYICIENQANWVQITNNFSNGEQDSSTFSENWNYYMGTWELIRKFAHNFLSLMLLFHWNQLDYFFEDKT